MSDTFCTYGEPGTFYGGDDYGLCGVGTEKACVSADDPTTAGMMLDPELVVPECGPPAIGGGGGGHG